MKATTKKELGKLAITPMQAIGICLYVSGIIGIVISCILKTA